VSQSLVDKVRLLEASLHDAGVDYILGGALALGYNVAEPRGTQDIDVLVYPPSGIASLVSALPDGIEVTPEAVSRLEADGQCRLYWGRTPVDIFLPVAPFHEEIRTRALKVRFPGIGRPVAVLAGTDLTVFKALFDRPKDWVDISEMVAYGSVDVPLAVDWLRRLGMDDRADRLVAISGP
jgi:hypothetical protein